MRPNPPGFPSCSSASHSLPPQEPPRPYRGLQQPGRGRLRARGQQHPQTRVSAGGGGHREGVCPFGAAAAGKWRRRGWQGLPGGRGSVGLRSWGSSGTGLVPSTRAPLPGLLSAASRGGKRAPIPRRWEGSPSSRFQAAVGARFLPGTSGKRGLQAPKLRAWGVSRAPRRGSVPSREGEEPL